MPLLFDLFIKSKATKTLYTSAVFVAGNARPAPHMILTPPCTPLIALSGAPVVDVLIAPPPPPPRAPEPNGRGTSADPGDEAPIPLDPCPYK